MTLSYLACPFRHVDPNIQKKRCLIAHYVAAKLSLQGHLIFSPLTHNSLLIDIIEDKVPPEHWMRFDLTILAACNKLIVLKLEGWESSKGVQREILFAQEKKILIEEMDPPKENLISSFNV